jgi:uncharacterized RDD family membrane protein YckC
MESHFEEFLEPQFDLAPIWKRILAFIIDFFIFASAAYIMGMFFGTPNKDNTGYSLNGIPALVQFTFGFILWPISEAIFGQTIGKRILNIQVVSNDLGNISIWQALKRFALGIFDYVLCIGILISALNKNNKRIGDLAAKTIVIKK